MNAAWHGPAIRGGLLALLAATLFGVSTVPVQGACVHARVCDHAGSQGRLR